MYDVTLPLRESAHVYLDNNGARFVGDCIWNGAVNDMLCCRTHSGRAGIGDKYCATRTIAAPPGLWWAAVTLDRFKTWHALCTERICRDRINFPRIHVLRYMRKQEIYNLTRFALDLFFCCKRSPKNNYSTQCDSNNLRFRGLHHRLHYLYHYAHGALGCHQRHDGFPRDALANFYSSCFSATTRNRQCVRF